MGSCKRQHKIGRVEASWLRAHGPLKVKDRIRFLNSGMIYMFLSTLVVAKSTVSKR